MSDDAQTRDLPDNSTPQVASTLAPPVGSIDDLPERLRVHSLARVLGTTSRKVLDALRELDGRSRSAHSSVDRTDAVRVRDVLAAETPADPAEASPAEAPEPEPATDATQPADSPDTETEPESRLMLEAPEQTQGSAAAADYLPLFVAPQPVEARPEPAPPAEDRAKAEPEGGTEDAEDGDESDEDGAERPANRRRRRGRRGRGRGRGADGEAGETTDGDAEDGAEKSGSDDSTSDTSGDDNDEESGGDGASRRRRRRRRRKSGSGDDADASSPDDPPNTVVHERAPRSKSGKGSDVDEIQGISGSTRLEAKRQRRRDGRDAGRRRPPILSEAEFLARREAVERVMVVRDKIRTEPPHQGANYTQIAVLEDGVVVEHFVTSAASASLVGNIYLGIVQNVLPSMEAAFVDIGRGRNGVLYAGEVNWEAAGLGGQNRKIEQALKPGDYVVVQVSKDPVGHKGARLTTQVSLAGRFLVYVPGASSTGISRKLPDNERQRLKEILREVVPADAGVIIRTASEGVKEDDIRADVTRLQEHWNKIQSDAADLTAKAAGAAVALYEEPNVLVKVIRDLFNEDFSNLIVSGDGAWDTINSYVNSVAPDLVSKLTKYESASSDGVPGPDVFAVHRIDEQLAKAMDRKVWLPSGGSLVIDRTEAMTVVDVNTGKFTGSGGNLEQTVTKNNLEAAEEIVRQLRLRDIGGIVVIDFIDMVLESNRDLVLRRLTESLARDRTRHQVSEVTSLGLVQLTRKKLGTGLVEAFSTNCTHCAGRGIVLHTDPVDSASASGPARKSESGGRRGRRGKKGRGDDSAPAETPAVAKVPAHPAGEHPMFKAMAAANGKHEDDESTDTEEPDATETEELTGAVGEQAGDDRDDDLDTVDDEQDADEDDEDSDEVDLDDDDLDDSDDEDDDDDLDDLDLDDSDDSDDDEDEDDSDDDEDDSDERAVVSVLTTGRPRRRRAAARPAGPPR